MSNSFGCDISSFERDPEAIAREFTAKRELERQQRTARKGLNDNGSGDDGAAQSKRRLMALTAGELLRMEIPEREMLLDPVLPSKGLVLVYSKRGVGKTFVALCIAYAVASGGACLRWH